MKLVRITFTASYLSTQIPINIMKVRILRMYGVNRNCIEKKSLTSCRNITWGRQSNYVYISRVRMAEASS